MSPLARTSLVDEPAFYVLWAGGFLADVDVVLSAGLEHDDPGVAGKRGHVCSYYAGRASKLARSVPFLGPFLQVLADYLLAGVVFQHV
jgi:hypothetical protein